MNKQNFQIVIYAVFGFLILVGFGSLALYGLLKKNEQSASEGSRSSQKRERIEVLVWGTLDADKADPIFKNLQGEAGRYATVRYREKGADTIEGEFARAVAYDDRVPDLLLLESAELPAFERAAALETIPFGYYPIMTVADYQRTFIQTADIFLRPGGYIALPILADSLVLYYNEGLRRQHDLRQLPTVWKDFTEKEYQDIAKAYRKSDKAIIPFGAYGNYTNAPYLFAALMLQAREFGIAAPPTTDLISFYSNFASLRSPVQTWNESLLPARSMFIGNKLLFYPGFVSEYQDLQRANPNIVMQAAPLPQLSADSTTVVPTKIYTLAIPRKGKHVTPAHWVVFDVAAVLQQFPLEIFDAIAMPPPINGFDRETRAALAITDGEVDAIKAFFNTITATEKVFIDALFDSRNVPLVPEKRAAILTALKNVIIGVYTARQEARTIEELFK